MQSYEVACLIRGPTTLRCVCIARSELFCVRDLHLQLLQLSFSVHWQADRGPLKVEL